jgi:hypothetical protein
MISTISSSFVCKNLFSEEGVIQQIHTCFIKAIESVGTYFKEQYRVTCQAFKYLINCVLDSRVLKIATLANETLKEPPIIQNLGCCPIQFWKAKLKEQPYFLCDAPNVIKQDLNFIRELVQKGAIDCIQWSADHIKKNKEFAAFVFSINGSALEHFDREIQDDINLVLLAIRNNGKSFKFASDRLKNNLFIILEAVKEDPSNFSLIPRSTIEEHIALYDLFKKNQDSHRLENADAILQDDENYVKAIVQSDGLQLQYASDRLKRLPSLVIKAIQNNENAYKFASLSLRSDKFITLLAVEKNGILLKWVSEDLKKDPDVVLRAVFNNKKALLFADNTFREDLSLSRKIIEYNPYAFEYLSPEIRSNHSIIEQVILLYKPSLKFANPNIFQEHHFLMKFFDEELKESGILIECGFSDEAIEKFRFFAHHQIVFKNSKEEDSCPLTFSKRALLNAMEEFKEVDIQDYFSSILLGLKKETIDPFVAIQKKIEEAMWTQEFISIGILPLFLFSELSISAAGKEFLIDECIKKIEIFFEPHSLNYLVFILFYLENSPIIVEEIEKILISLLREEKENLRICLQYFSALLQFFPNKVNRLNSLALTKENLAMLIMEDFFRLEVLYIEIQQQELVCSFLDQLLEFKNPQEFLFFLDDLKESKFAKDCSLIFFQNLLSNRLIETRHALTSHQEYLTEEQRQNWFEDLPEEPIENQLIEKPLDLELFKQTLIDQNIGFGLIDRLIFQLKGGEIDEPLTALEEKINQLIHVKEADEDEIMDYFASIYEEMTDIEHPFKSYIETILDDYQKRDDNSCYTIYETENIEDFLYTLKRTFPESTVYDASLPILLDGKYRLLAIKNGSGDILDWVYLRIMMLGVKPVLYVELSDDKMNIYPLINFALKKAKKLGVDLYVSNGCIVLHSFCNILKFEIIFQNGRFIDTDGNYTISCRKVDDE